MAQIAEPRNPIAAIDWPLLSMLLSLIAIGWLMIYAAGIGQGYPESWGEWLTGTPVGKQTIFVGISAALLIFTLVANHRLWRDGAFLIYLVMLLLLLGVVFFGREIKGARSWYNFGGFGLQPSEFAKFGAVLAMASFLAAYRGQVKNVVTWFQAAGLFLLPAGLIMLQPDAGSALVFLGLTIMLYRAGLNAQLFVVAGFGGVMLVTGLVFSPTVIATCLFGLAVVLLATQFPRGVIYGVGALAGLLALLYFGNDDTATPYLGLALVGSVFAGLAIYWYPHRKSQLVQALTAMVVLGTAVAATANYLFNNALAPHQQDRLNVWLQPSKCDPRGSLYNVLQSKMAIGSGGLQGKGFLEGTLTKLRYVPEQTTDFIFCTVGEEHGFIGAAVVIGLFLGVLLRLVSLAERQRSVFAQYYMYGVTGILFVHFALNIGMTMGLMPIIGIPLPFISYGGSSLMAFTLIMGVALRLDATRTERE